jgi:putative addiction module component (TIGR02574 family)
MSDRTAELLRKALELTTQERAELAAELIASVDGAPDPEAEEAWAQEIERRASRARAGVTQGHEWSDVKARVLSKISKG